jgi:hypothetical protein
MPSGLQYAWQAGLGKLGLFIALGDKDVRPATLSDFISVPWPLVDGFGMNR